MEMIRLEQVSFQYSAGKQKVLNAIDLQIHSGEFLVLCGASGCGKTTLLRQLKPAIAAHGFLEGRILFHGENLQEVNGRTQTAGIGFVNQNPEEQIVTDKVWHELAFGLESLGVDSATIQKRVAEMSHFFGIQEWFHQSTAQLSGGQKQLLNLASVMVMQPEILLLDEPTSQLDPIAASEFLTTLGRIHRELGTTILMTEHRLDEVIPLCTRLLVMEQGQLTLQGAPMEVAEEMRRQEHMLFAAMPTPIRIWNGVEQGERQCPLTVQEGRVWFQEWAAAHTITDKKLQEQITAKQAQAEQRMRKNDTGKPPCTVELKDIWFRYGKNEEDILKGISLQGYAGELLAVLGGNGCGKTTLLGMIHGGLRPYRGKVRFPAGKDKRIIHLPQNPQLLFTEGTVEEELLDMRDCGIESRTKEEFDRQVQEVIALCQLSDRLEHHPYDLSGGEQQRLALGKILLTQPDILLLDEPTKGFDVEYKEVFAGILKELTAQGVTIIMVSHDVEFCAEHADRCMLVFDGQVSATDLPNPFFSENYFYTTNANRMVRQQLPMAVTVSEVIEACGGTVEKKTPPAQFRHKKEKDMESENELSKKKDNELQSRHVRLKTIVAIIVTLCAIPFTIYAGNQFLQDQRYVFIALLIIVEAMLPFLLAFERRKTPARDLVLLAVFCAMGVAGRGIFAMVPAFKPVTALTIIAGVAFGGETGFLVGAITMLVSNMLFGQGPWTPWQMFAMGIIGFLAGIIFHRKKYQWQERKKCNGLVFGLCIYGFLAAVLLYGGIMNPSTAMLAGLPLDWKAIGAYYLSGLPFDLAHGVATVLFLMLGSKMMLRRIERVKIKYGSSLI